MKKVLSDYLISYNISVDKFPNSKYYGKLNNYYTDDILKLVI
jgi:hypothetical protein